MVQLTEKAIGKVKEIMASQQPSPAGLRIAVDCANGAYAHIAPKAFEALGAPLENIGIDLRVERRPEDRARLAARVPNRIARGVEPTAIPRGFRACGQHPSPGFERA